MEEPDFLNYSSLTAAPYPLLDRDGRECRLVVVKATYTLASNGQLAERPRPVRVGDEMWGTPEVADIRHPGDLCCNKPGTDVVFVGHVRGDGTRTHADVRIEFAGRVKHLRVHGERFWDQTFSGVGPGSAAPLEEVPLAWRLSYGGFDASDPEHPVEEPRNPVGRGVARRERDLIGRPAPQIEARDHPVTSAGRHNQPAGCSAIGRHYEPRRAFAGTYDRDWVENRCPGRPADYDERHENAAPPDFVFTEPVRGGETGSITGLTPGGRIEFSVPATRIVISALIDGSERQHRPHLDTLLIDPGAGIMECVWRAAFTCPAKMRNRFTYLKVEEKHYR